MKKLLFLSCTLFSLCTWAQKKPLDHTVYDGWQSISDRQLSNDGNYLAYAVNPQEGDGILYIRSARDNYRKEIARGYGAVITEDSRFLICRIKPFFRDTREARIKKRKPEDMPKDSLAIVELGKDPVIKIARVKSYQLPEDSGNWLAYLLEKPLAETIAGKPEADSARRVTGMLRTADSLVHMADSIRSKAAEVQNMGMGVLRNNRKETVPVTQKTAEEPFEEGTDLVLQNLVNGEVKTYQLVSEFLFNRKGTALVIETTRKTGDAQSKAAVVKIDLATGNSTTVFKGFNDAKGYRMDEEGTQLGFVAERDSSSKSLRKFYKLYYHKTGMDSAIAVADRNSRGLAANWTISENANITFSKSGQRMFAGTAGILPVKDTSLPDFERVSVDIWHYKDDYIQPVQLKNLDNELRRSYPARVDLAGNQLVQLGNETFRNLLPTKEWDGSLFYAVTDAGKRVASQWQGFTLNDIYTIHPETGAVEKIAGDVKGNLVQPSYSGKYLLYYDEPKKAYFVYNSLTRKTRQVAKDIPTALYDEENDVPDDPNAYGVLKWMEDEKYVLIYDRYDVWKIDVEAMEKSVCLTSGRKDKIEFRYVNTNPDEKFIRTGQKMLMRLFDNKDKSSGLAFLDLGKNNTTVLFKEPVSLGQTVQKAKNAEVLAYTKESFVQSPNLYLHPAGGTALQVSHTNPQQAGYNWGTAELFKWKAYTGKETEGILYKPEDFDPEKKYPMIVYFYERNNQTLHHYLAPAPTPSRLNIPFFVSRGYVVLVPDIWYTRGHPGQSAYDYILSGTRAVVKRGYVDSTKIGLQGQSWGGYQIVYLITRTHLYAAAWAGAPVANMTSAYGGIRWGSGLVRQFQYEKTQSRIGASLWEQPRLYIENSALFSLPKVNTPLVIMANDADDAVPWYQGIEMFAGMRRLNKKVWMLTYNGEAHNLVERKNRKDIQVREQQFFDYLLKGEKPAKWISQGVPAVLKGRDLGLGYE